MSGVTLTAVEMRRDSSSTSGGVRAQWVGRCWWAAGSR
jgi:hypothetical protein